MWRYRKDLTNLWYLLNVWQHLIIVWRYLIDFWWHFINVWMECLRDQRERIETINPFKPLINAQPPLAASWRRNGRKNWRRWRQAVVALSGVMWLRNLASPSHLSCSTTSWASQTTAVRPIATLVWVGQPGASHVGRSPEEEWSTVATVSPASKLWWRSRAGTMAGQQGHCTHARVSIVQGMSPENRTMHYSNMRSCTIQVRNLSSSFKQKSSSLMPPRLKYMKGFQSTIHHQLRGTWWTARPSTSKVR